VLDGLAAELERLGGRADACCLEDGETLDAAGKVGALIAPMLVDLLVARAVAGGGTGRLTATGLTSPLFLLPPAARLAADGWHLRFALAGPGGARHLLSAGPQGAAVLGPAPDLAGLAEHDLQAACTRDAEALVEPGAPGLDVLADAKALASREARSLAEGLQVSPERWERLQVFAHETLVPATEESRRRGAGELAGG
jgi:hypothetical protein